MRNRRTWVTSHQREDYIVGGHRRYIQESADTPERHTNNSLKYNRIANILYEPRHPDYLRLGIDYFI